MNDIYFKRLLKKLKFHHQTIRDYGKEEVTITLSKAEIDDLFYLWKSQARNIFALGEQDE